MAKMNKNIYTSPTIPNEMIKLMGISILHVIASTLQSTSFPTPMVDETTDAYNTEQVYICVGLQIPRKCIKNFLGCRL